MFRINVVCDGCYTKVWSHPASPELELGLTGLDLIRSILGVPNLPVDRICFESIRLEERTAVVIHLTEKQARKAKRFDNINCVTVKVPEDYLNQFYVDAVKTAKDETTGEITKAYMYREIDQQRFINHWLGLGAPLVIEGDEE